MGWFSNFTDDVLGFDPNGGGINDLVDDVAGVIAIPFGIPALFVKAGLEWLTPDAPELDPYSIGTRDRSILANAASNIAKIPVIYGTRRVGGIRTFQGVSGVNNEHYWRVFTLAEGEIDAINNVYLDDLVSTDSKFLSTVQITKYLGSDTQVADAGLMAAFPTLWTTAHRGQGVAYVIVRLTFNPDVYSRVPTVTVDVRGKKAFDTRTSTTAYSSNPSLCIYDYLTNQRYGKKISTTLMDTAAFNAAANDCDEQIVSYTSGPNINRFECHGVVDTAQDIKSNVEDLLSSCRGLLPFTGGFYKLIIDKDTAPTMTMTTDNIIGGWTIQAGSKRARLNRAKAKFTNPAKDWQSDFAITDSSALRALDAGLMLEREINFPFETNVYRALYHTEVIIKKSRQSITCSFLASPEALQVEVGNVIAITHATPGWVAKKFRVNGLTLRVDGLVAITCAEHEATAYDRAVPVEAPTPADTNLPDPRVVPAPGSVSVYSGEDEIITAQDGTLVSRIRAVIPVSGSIYVIGTEVDYKLSSDYLWKPAGYIASRTETTLYISPVDDGVNYDIRARHLNAMDFYSPYATITNYTAIGKTTPPPPATNFFTDRMPDGTRVSRWDYLSQPKDFAGFKIRYKLGTNQLWDSMTDLHTGLLSSSPYEFNQLAAGTYTIAIKAVDTTGNQSTSVNANVILGDPRLAGIITDRYPRNEGWPGIKASCFVDNTGSLLGNSTTTWDTLPSTWDAWTAWAMNPVSPISYEHPAIDLGNIVPFTPLITVIGTGAQTIEVATSNDGITYTAFGLPATVTTRFFKVKVTMTGTGLLIIDSMTIYASGQVKDEYVENVNVTISGARINYLGVGDFRVLPMKSYAIINYINLAFQNFTPVANETWTWSVMDKSISLGPRLNIYKNGSLANLPGAASCDFYIKGL